MASIENKIFRAIIAIKAALKSCSEFKLVGDYPMDVPKAITAGNSPCLLVQEGDEGLSEYQFNLTNDKTFMLSVWIYNDNDKSRIETLSDLQLLVEQTILSDALRTASQAYCIEWDSAEKGGYLDNFDGYSIGYSNSKSLRKINFKVLIQTVR